MWADIFFVSSAAIFVCCLFLAVWSAQRAVRAAESLRAKSRSFESRIGLLETSRDELTQLHEELANRVKMMRVRNTTAGPRSSSGQPGELPDPYRDPDGWRTAMNKRIAMRGLNGGAE